MAKNATKITVDKLKSVLEGMAVLQATKVYAGIPSDRADRDPDPEEDEVINNAALMYIHENGAPEANIPARPVVKPAITSIQPQIIAGFRNAGVLALSGKPAAVMAQFSAIGLLAQNAMRARITDGPFVALSERTLAERRRRGFKGIKPLIRTGQLRRALTYVIRSFGKWVH